MSERVWVVEWRKHPWRAWRVIDALLNRAQARQAAKNRRSAYVGAYRVRAYVPEVRR